MRECCNVRLPHGAQGHSRAPSHQIDAPFLSARVPDIHCFLAGNMPGYRPARQSLWSKDILKIPQSIPTDIESRSRRLASDTILRLSPGFVFHVQGGLKTSAGKPVDHRSNGSVSLPITRYTIDALRIAGNKALQTGFFHRDGILNHARDGFQIRTI